MQIISSSDCNGTFKYDNFEFFTDGIKIEEDFVRLHSYAQPL